MKKRHRKTMRGTVLFTTVSVMALLIIFLMGTLVLASASNSRAHKSYSTAQATYTARAAIDNFVEAMKREGAIAAAVQEVAQPGASGDTTKLVKVNLADNSLGVIGHIDPATGDFVPGEILIQNVGGGEYEYINDKGESVLSGGAGVSDAKWVELDRVKISATAKVGSELETVAAYVRKKPSKSTTTHSGGSGPVVKGIQMTGSAGLPTGENITGGLGVNLGSLSTSVEATTQIRNKMDIVTSLSFLNGNIVWKTADAKIIVRESKPVDGEPDIPYSQTVIKGSLFVDNDSFITLDYNMPDGYSNGDWSNKEVPYLFVDGALVANKLNVRQNQGKSSAYNIFAGTYVAIQNEATIGSANIYLMDEYDDSKAYTVYSEYEYAEYDGQTYSKGKSPVYNPRANRNDFVQGDNYIGYQAGTTKLSKWTSSIATGTYATADIGGSIFCNGRLTLQQCEIAGDVYVEGDCIIKNGVTIQGNLKVGGNLDAPQGWKPNGTQTVGKTTPSGSVDVTPIKNYHVDAGAVDMTKMEAINLTGDDTYKINYIEWIPANHKSTTIENQYGVDLWGHPVGENDLKLYYKWVDTADVTADLVNKTNMFVNNTSYEELNSNPDFDALRQNIADDPCKLSPTDTDVPGVKHSNGNGDYYYYGVPTFKDGAFIPKGQEADETIVYYRNTDTNAVMTQTEIDAAASIPEHYIRVNLDGSLSGEECGMHEYTYYRNNNNSDFTYDETAAGTPATPAGAGVYPQDMTREKIYGEYTSSGFQPADTSTKIITTLQEARESLGLQPTGEVDTSAYPSVFDGTQAGAPDVTGLTTAINNMVIDDESVFESDSSKAVTIGSTTVTPIVKSCRIHGSIISNGESDSLSANNMTAVSGKVQVNGSSDKFHILCFKPGDKDLYIYLDDVDANNCALYVDRDPDNDGQVYFIVNKNFRAADKVLVIPSYFQAGMSFDHTQDWGITYYGSEESSITMANDSLMVGCFKMPYTKFTAGVRGQMTVTYTGEDGVQLPPGKPSIVGNALFSEVNVQNNFINYYTATGGSSGSGGGSGGGTTVKTEVGYFDIMYMLGN